ncbi:folylpolyglutamate synthase/dihydrofolate synthase family protein [Lactobacillus sp. HT06-2]|uniref:bifunctional folylpolyglutamate synthase/dihydrofolate synthase n=1 Tax=Lactobacillus sp. HT06-2 TaxID=2080222 RepID=UPI000CD89B22|nr:folylpolyglutamate synthase/dihydrofolate synthase family protein [Lactobacillus sp. HT06-2]
MKFTNAHEVISYLYTLPHLHAKSDLSYIKRILAVLDNPQDKVKTLHATGTNGKGSTSYYLSNLLQKAGQKTGLFVSPFVREFNERIQLNGQDIPDQDLVKTANIVEEALTKIRQQDEEFSLVTFEYEVALAFEYFALNHCDYAVIEVGIGGEHDKTNVIMPAVSIITTVGLDHEQIIGPTLADIAVEKSGIIKYKRPVVLGSVPELVLPVLTEKAEKEKAPVYLLNRDYHLQAKERFEYRFADRQLHFKLRPEVEGYDIAIAVTAFLLLKLPLNDEQIMQAIDQTVIPGRYQLLSNKPTIILDGAHNIQAMKNLLKFVRKSHQEPGKIKVLMTMMKDKDLAQVFSLFKDEEVTLTTIPYPRAAKLADFPAAVRARYRYEADYQVAYRKLRENLQTGDTLLITGSFYLVSAILKLEEDRCEFKE